jgi:diguanylate cyclase (GGDEF)-like protein
MLEEMNNSELGQILKACPMGVALSNEQKQITWVNEAFEKYLGISAKEINGQKIDELPEVLQPLFTSSDAVHIPANSIRGAQWYMCNQQPLNGNTVHYISDVAPMQALKEERDLLKDELREALAIDEVTGMANKIGLFQRLEPAISRSRRYGNLLSIVILRIDNIEQLDKLENAKLMIEISHLLNDQVRWADIVGKLSTTDFLLVLPETAGEDSQKLITNLSKNLENLELPEELPADYKISFKFSHAQWEKGDDLTLLMNKARDNLQ